MKFIFALLVLFLQSASAFAVCAVSMTGNQIPGQTEWDTMHNVYHYEPGEGVVAQLSDCNNNVAYTNWSVVPWTQDNGGDPNDRIDLAQGQNSYSFTAGTGTFSTGFSGFMYGLDWINSRGEGVVVNVGYRPAKPTLSAAACVIDPVENVIKTHLSIGPEDDHPSEKSAIVYSFAIDGQMVGSEVAEADGTLELSYYPEYGDEKLKVIASRVYFKHPIGTPGNVGFPITSVESNEIELNCPEKKSRKCGPGDLVDEDGQTCGPEDPEDANNTNNCPFCDSRGKPVNVANGFLWHQNTDFSLPGRTAQTGLTLLRTYTAVNGAPLGDFGPNWRHNWETRLEIAADVIWVDENGGPWTFRYLPGSSELTSPPGNPAKLTRFADRYELVKQDKTKLTFSLEGNLVTYTDRFGESVALAYDSGGKLQSITTPLAGTVSFTRNAQGTIASATRVRDSLTYTYTYDGQGRLWKVTDFANRTYEYNYNSGQVGTYANGMLSSIRDPLNRLTQFTYYNDGRAHQQMEPGGEVRTFRYEFSPLSKRLGRKSGTRRRTDFISSTRVDDVDGSSTTYYFDGRFRTFKTVHQEDGTLSHQTWNAAGYLGSKTDEVGATTFLGYDERGNLNSIQLPGKAYPTTTTYDETFNVPVTIYSPGRGGITNTINPADGTISQTEQSDGTNTLGLSYTRDSFGNLLSTNNSRATYADVRNANGLLTTVYDAHNPETRAYDSRYRLSTRTFSSGRVLTYGYDDDDRIISIQDSHGSDISNAYDAMGRLVSRSISAGSNVQTTTYTWDVHDRLTSKTDALGRKTQYFYSKNRVLLEPSQIKDPAGRITKFSYDRRGRLSRKTDAKGVETKYSYNGRGDLISVTDGLGQTTWYEYSASGKRTKEIRPSVAGQSSSAHVITYEYDDADRLTKETHVSQTGGTDRSILFGYDIFDRMISKTLMNGASVEDHTAFTYESQLDNVSMASANNHVVNLSFVNEAAPPFAITGYSVAAAESGNPKGLVEDSFTVGRDGAGNIASVSGANSGAIFTKAYDPAGRLSGFNAKNGALTGAIAYDGFGRRKSISFSDGAHGDYTYDLLDRVVAINWKEKYKDSVRQNLVYDLAGNVVRMAREHSTYDLAYDVVNQLIGSKMKGMQGVPAYNKFWEYDALGNRIGSDGGAGSFVSNFLTQNGTSSFTADPDGFGQTVQENIGDKAKNYTYRADGKIASFSSGALVVNYHYDGLDRLIAKAINENGNAYTQSFVHLGDEHRVLLGKAGDGIVTTYVDGQGVAEHLGEVKGSVGKAYLTDHLGSVLNSPPAGSWKIYGIFGESSAPAAIGPTTSPVTYGFTGHMIDLESGLNRTPHRLYNPKIGSWVSQDPIGYRAGDTNYYRYVFNQPLLNTDLSGLRCEKAIGLGAGIVGVGAFTAYWFPIGGCAIAGIGLLTAAYGAYGSCPDDPPATTEKPTTTSPEKKIEDALKDDE